MGGRRRAAAKSDLPFRLSSPVEYETFQRQAGGTGTIVIAGTIASGSGTHDIEASFNGGAYATIATSVSGVFSGTLTNQAAGQGALRVRFVDNTATLQDVANVGIGGVFVVAGQSNAAGLGNNAQAYSHATLKATCLYKSYVWNRLTDPSHSNAYNVDAAQYYEMLGGSYWPLLATAFMADQGVPIAIVPCAVGGTGIAQWQPGANHQDPATLYGSMVKRALLVQGGVKAVLWHQGESEAIPGMAQATYNAYLDTLANAIADDLGCPLVAAKIHRFYYGAQVPEANVLAIHGAIDDAVADNVNVLLGPDFYTPTNITDDLHFLLNAELQEAADRWWAAIDAAFYA